VACPRSRTLRKRRGLILQTTGEPSSPPARRGWAGWRSEEAFHAFPDHRPRRPGRADDGAPRPHAVAERPHDQRSALGCPTDRVPPELGTNSLRHAGLQDAAAVRVSAAFEDRVLRIEVEDGGTSGAVIRRTPNRDGGGGFGLNIIDALALRWGVKRAGGTLVWVELGC
jgi:hypothetical protein